MSKVRFVNGLKLKRFFCPRCLARRDGTVYRERWRWRAKLTCGHHKMLGMVLPIEELERRGYVNYDPDPKRTALRERMERDQFLENIEKQKYIERKLTM